MKIVGLAVLGVIVGFLSGLVISEVIGMAGMLLFQRAVGIKYLPVYLAILGAAGGMIFWKLIRRG